MPRLLFHRCCSPTQRLGNDSCTWRVLKRVKTIDAKCLVQVHGIAESCQAELPTGKVDATVKIFDSAFRYDDLQEGGCPPIEP